jgi:very-short-patch-repair endonuclease
MLHISYNKNLKEYSRSLRNNGTIGEALLWTKLRSRNMMGYQFNRQKPLGNYIVDFYCQVLKLVIEIDGQYHTREEMVIKDADRQNILEEMGLSCIRFSELQVRNDMTNVLRTIEHYILNYEDHFPEIKEKAKRRAH